MNGDAMPTTPQHGVAVQYDPELKKRHLLEAARRLPGPDYYEVLRCVHRILKPKTYVEIGIRDGASLACALPDTRCAGVDPAPTIFPPTPVNVRVYAMTSDDFFAGHSPQDAFGTVRFDFAFIDGLHLFEQALLDFIHLERWAGPRSIIAIHDCLPLDGVTSERTRTTHFYTGDVWKAVACLKKHRPDLMLRTIRTAPAGLCLISGLNSRSEVLPDRFEEIVREYRNLGFGDYMAHPEWMPRETCNTHDAVEECLRELLQDCPLQN